MHWMLLPTTRPYLALAALASLVLNLALLVPALYMLQVFDRVFASRSVETLVMLGLFALLALALAFAMDRARSLLLARAGQAVDDALSRAALAGTLEAAARGQASAQHQAALADVGRLRHFLAGPAVQALFDAPWLPVYLAVIALLHPVLGWAAAASALALFGLGLASERLLRQRSSQASHDGDQAAQAIDRLQRHAEPLLAMGMLGNGLAHWQGLHQQAQGSQQRLHQRATTLAASGRQLRQAVQVLLLGLGAWLVVAGHASPGIMIATTLLVGRALAPVEQLIAGWRALLDVRSAWQRLNSAPLPHSLASAPRLPAVQGALQLDRVSVLAEGGQATLLKGISLQLAPGECLGLVGPSGAGKTTLLRLVMGLRQAHAGAVRLDGLDVAQWPAAQWADSVGYLPQDVALFAGTVAQNIARLAPVDCDAAMAQVVAAAQTAGVHDMVMRLPQGYDTPVEGPGGAGLSGGQRQRIALARAVYGSPKLVVLDEPSAHLDAAGEDALAATLAGLKAAGTTVLLVSHRPALMRQADALAVLQGGAVTAHGPRDQVLARLSGATVLPLRPPVAVVGGAFANAKREDHTPAYSGAMPPTTPHRNTVAAAHVAAQGAQA